jgi:hypothetical protein
MQKLDYPKAIMYGILLPILSCVLTLVTTMLITKRPGLSLTLGFLIPLILLLVYVVVIIKMPDKIGFCTDEDQKHWQIKLIYGMSILIYMITSLGVYYIKSQVVGKVMFLATPLFLLIGRIIDIVIKKKESTG